jgi:hypothetical protein
MPARPRRRSTRARSLAFQGAADSAKWGAITGGDAGKGAWIGAVAVVGIGLLVGVVVRTKKGIDAYREYRAGYERCMTVGLQPAEFGTPGGARGRRGPGGAGASG